MGYYRHHAIIVTGTFKEKLKEARDIAIVFCLLEGVSPIIESQMNGYQSFFIAPDGGQEGWDDSELGDARRDTFINWLEEQRSDEGSTWLDWVEVQYGDGDKQTRVTRDNDEWWRKRR